MMVIKDQRLLAVGSIFRVINVEHQCFRWGGVRCVKPGESLFAATGELLEGAFIQQCQQGRHGGIQFGHREELPVAQSGEDPTFHNLYAHLHLGLIPSQQLSVVKAVLQP